MKTINIVRTVVVIIVIILLIVAIIFTAMDKLPKEWRNMEQARNYSNIKTATGNLQTNLSAKEVKYRNMAELILIGLVDKHCTLHHCDRDDNSPVRFFLKLKDGKVFYAASLEPSQYQVLYVTPGSYTILAEMTQRAQETNGVEKNENEATDLSVHLSKDNSSYVTVTHTQTAMEQFGSISLSEISSTQASAYLHSKTFSPADDDPIVINTKSEESPLYDEVVQTRGYHYDLSSYRLIRCNMLLKSGARLTCIYDFFRTDADNDPLLLTNNPSCPQLNTLLKKNDLGLDLNCYFISTAGYTSADSNTSTVPASVSVPTSATKANTNNSTKNVSNTNKTKATTANNGTTNSDTPTSSGSAIANNPATGSAAENSATSGQEVVTSNSAATTNTPNATANGATSVNNTKQQAVSNTSPATQYQPADNAGPAPATVNNAAPPRNTKVPSSTTSGSAHKFNLPITNQEDKQ